MWTNPRSLKSTLYPPLGIKTFLLIDKNILQSNGTTLHTNNFTNAYDLTRTVPKPCLLHNNVKGGTDLVANRLDGKFDTTHENHGLKT